jgi:hypothetical protein
MYDTYGKASIHVKDSMKNIILIGLMFSLALSLLGGYLISRFGFFEGTELGQIVYILFIFSEIPILVNYFYYVVSIFGFPVERFASIFTKYYTPGLLVHSVIYTFMIGLTFAHLLSVFQQSVYCVLFIGVLGLLWIIDYVLWSNNWPLYPRAEAKPAFLYYLQWVILFGLLIGIPFHARTSSLFWISAFPTITFGSLFIVIIQEFRDKRTNNQKRVNSVS